VYLYFCTEAIRDGAATELEKIPEESESAAPLLYTYDEQTQQYIKIAADAFGLRIDLTRSPSHLAVVPSAEEAIGFIL
jgi:hypothetical protein